MLSDVFGVLADWRSSLIDIGAATGTRADWPVTVDDWRRAYQPALARARQDASWRDLDAAQRGTLDEILERYAVDLPAAGRESLVRGRRQPRPWPDGREGLGRLSAPR